MSKQPSHLWPIEQKWIPSEDLGKGPLQGCSWGVYSLSAILIILCLYGISILTPNLSNLTIAIALCLCARLIIVDLKALVLPNIYTGALIVLGLLNSLQHGWEHAAITLLSIISITVALVLFVLLIEKLSNGKSTLGGGDIKMIAAITAWAPLTMLSPLICLACLITFTLLPFVKNKAAIPFGPGLGIALFIQLLYPNWLTSILALS